MSQPHRLFRRGSEALDRALHRGADALGRGLQHGGDALDRGLARGAERARTGASSAGERLRTRFRRRRPGTAPEDVRNPAAAFPTNSEEPGPTPCPAASRPPPGAGADLGAVPESGNSGPFPSEHSDDPRTRKTMCIFKSILRVGVIGGLLTAAAVGGTVLVAGTERSAALFDRAKGQVLERLDSAIDDPTALRAQLEELEAQYPERISMLRGDLAELNEQVRQLERDRAIAERVVALAERDIESLEPRLSAAQRAAAQGEETRLAGATIQHENRLYTVRQASTRLQQIQQTKVAYANRAADAAHDLVYLKNQAGRLDEMLLQLETERAQFQAQIAQLERQVDAVARNERLIAMLEKRQKTLEECSRYEAASLDHIVGRLAEVRSRQEATLEYLTGDQRRQDYESIARMQLDADGASEDYSGDYTDLEVPASEATRILKTAEGLTVVR